MRAPLSRLISRETWESVSRPWIWDTATAALTAAISLSEASTATEVVGRPYHRFDLLAVLLVAVAGAALAGQRFAPEIAVGLSGAVAVALSARGYVTEPPVHLLGLSGPAIGPVAALYALALRHGRGRSVPAAAYATVTGIAAQAAFVPGAVLPAVAGTVVILAAAWAIGDARRDRRRYVAAVRARADRLARERHALADLAVARERARIARELHDVVAHHVSLMIVSAAAAERQLRRDPEAARDPLSALMSTGKAAVVEMRRMLGVLRSDDADDQDPGRHPQPTLEELDALIDAFAGAGLAVGLTVSGSRRLLAAGVELTAFRILQESLTNVLRHAGAGTQVSVTVAYEEHRLLLEVRDHGGAALSAPVPSDTGHGLVGMRERAALLGGSLVAAPMPGGGFRVQADLPLTGNGWSGNGRSGNGWSGNGRSSGPGNGWPSGPPERSGTPEPTRTEDL